MPAERDPLALLDQHEAQVRARLKHQGAALRTRSRAQAAGALDWARQHPGASLAIAAGAGFLAAPRKGRASGSLKRIGRMAILSQVGGALSDFLGAPPGD